MKLLNSNNVELNNFYIDNFINFVISNPFVCVWALSILVWFFLELVVLTSSFFNFKYAYSFYTKRILLSLNSIILILKKNSNKKNYLKVLYKLYI